MSSEAGAARTRAQPFLCPYCGEEDLRPAGEAPTEYHCRSCDRRFDLTFLGLGPGANPPTGPPGRP